MSKSDDSMMPLQSRLSILQALAFVNDGDLDSAEYVLTANRDTVLSEEALDLLARIYVQKGEFTKAKEVWFSLLQRNPAHQAANRAIAAMKKPWLIWAILKRFGYLAACALGLFLALTGIFYYVEALHPYKPETQEFADIRPSIRATPEAQQQCTSFSAWPQISVSGCSVLTNDDHLAIVFLEPIFRTRCEMEYSATQMLIQAFEAITNSFTNNIVIIEGHADATPPSPGSAFSDNYSLALARASCVAAYLRVHCGEILNQVFISSAGSENPPFPDPGEESQLRNRTVVLKILRWPIDKRAVNDAKNQTLNDD